MRQPTSVARSRRRFLSLAAVALLGLVLALPLLAAAPASAAETTWSTLAAGLPGAAEASGAGRGVTVAVLDTWVDKRHPDFGGRVLDGATCEGGTCRPGGADSPDACEPHGTHVAGIVASQRFGVAPQASVLPVRVLTAKNGSCNAQARDVATGVRWAVAHGAQVINISLGSTYALDDDDRVITRAVTDASRAGVVVVAAAGNGKTAGADVYGGSALIVAATAPNGALADYSQRGSGVDIAAPGGQPRGDGCTAQDCVVSTWSDDSYAADAGTSMAAPYVAGGAALLLSEDPKRGRANVVSTLLKTARPLAGAGAGRVNLLAAVRATPGRSRPAASSPSPAAGTGPASATDPSAAAPVRVVGPDGTTVASTQLRPVPRPATGNGTRTALTVTAAALVAGVAIAVVLVVRARGLAGTDRPTD